MGVYPHLFSPLTIGSVTVRNRIMQTAHVKLFAHDGVDSQRNVDYQAARAKGGAGLLITGNRVVHPTSTTGFPRVAWAYLPEALEADRRLTDAAHQHDSVIFAPLNHFGLNAASDSADDLRVLWGPSAVKSPTLKSLPSTTIGDDEMVRIAIACSSLICHSRCLITSKVIGSMSAPGRIGLTS